VGALVEVNLFEHSIQAFDFSLQRQQFETLFNKGSFEKGTIWVPVDGCAVKLILDEAIVQNDGSVDKGHYELALIKK
jgi:hypothetical protein